MDLMVHSRRALSLWINHVCWEERMFDIEEVDKKVGVKLLAWLHGNQNTLREYSLRTVHKLCVLSKMHVKSWELTANMTLLRVGSY